MAIVCYHQDASFYYPICSKCGSVLQDRMTLAELAAFQKWLKEEIVCMDCDNVHTDEIPPSLAPFDDGEPYLLVFEDRVIVISPWSTIKGQQHIIEFLRSEVKGLCQGSY